MIENNKNNINLIGAQTQEDDCDHNKIASDKDESLSVDMDTINLLNCSHKLLDSVSETLNKVTCDNSEVNKLERNISQENHTISENYNESSSPTISIPNAVDDIILKKQFHLPECSVRQWAKELIVAVEGLHKNNIICG